MKELTEKQRLAVRLQWIILGSFTVLWLLFIFVLRTFFLMPYALIAYGLVSLLIGVLSVRCKVTILGRRWDFWRPRTGRNAVFIGWFAIIVGLVVPAFWLFMFSPFSLNSLVEKVLILLIYYLIALLCVVLFWQYGLWDLQEDEVIN